MAISTITWVHVPPGTQLEVSVEPEDGGLTSGGDIVMHDKGQVPVKQWCDDDLRPGPAVELLKTGVDYTVDIRVTATGTSATAGTVTAALREASNGLELDRQQRPFNVVPGTHDLVRIFADADPVVPVPVVALPPAAPMGVGPVGGASPRARAGRRRTRARKRGK